MIMLITDARWKGILALEEILSYKVSQVEYAVQGKGPVKGRVD